MKELGFIGQMNDRKVFKCNVYKVGFLFWSIILPPNQYHKPDPGFLFYFILFLVNYFSFFFI